MLYMDIPEYPSPGGLQLSLQQLMFISTNI